MRSGGVRVRELTSDIGCGSVSSSSSNTGAVTSAETSISNHFEWGETPGTITLDIHDIEHAEVDVDKIQRVVGAKDVLLRRGLPTRTSIRATPEAAMKYGYPGGFTILDSTVLGRRRFYRIDPTSSWLREQLRFSVFPVLSITLFFRSTNDDEAVDFMDDFAQNDRSTVWLGETDSSGVDDSADRSAESDWPEVVNARLSELERLTEDWDSYGSKPVAPEVSARVRALLHQLMTPRTRTPQVVPLPDGGLQLEWHTLSSDLEICVPASGVASFFYQDVKSSSQRDGKLPADQGVLKKLIDGLER